MSREAAACRAPRPGSTRPSGRLAILAAIACLVGLVSACEADEPASRARQPIDATASEAAATPLAPPTPPTPPTAPTAPPAPVDAASPASRQVYFGDLHVHSSWSLDAYAAGVEAIPIDAYRYARGESIPHVSGQPIALAGPPLDFMALTDHAEYLGLTVAASMPGHPVREQPLIRSWKGADPQLRRLAWEKILTSYAAREGLPALQMDEIVMPAWRGLVQLANREYRPGVFTPFIGFEYSPNPEGQNLHRNVIFRGNDAPDRPFSAMDSPDPEDLWRWMDETRARHGDLLAIPHNANGSNGLMFAPRRHDGSPIDAEWAALRHRNEPIAEVIQIKGQSETHPSLSPDDAWADFEIADWRTTQPGLASRPDGSYLRRALEVGLGLEARLGLDPFELGMIGSTDGHNASSPFEESNYTGKIGRTDGTPEARLDWLVPGGTEREPVVSQGTRWSAAGLAAVWADANTREALFDAMRRRETYATSGPRLTVRFFGGWDFEASHAKGEIAAVGYARGTPMGGTLSPAPEADTPPSFLVAAQQDPLEAGLERVQIVKGWWQGDAPHERVYDVACARGTAPDPATHRCAYSAPEPDLATCATAPEAGAAQLSGWWRDPDYDPALPAFYYARVLQVPTCRWSTFDALRLGRPPHEAVPATIQERAITSPVWVRGRGSRGLAGEQD